MVLYILTDYRPGCLKYTHILSQKNFQQDRLDQGKPLVAFCRSNLPRPGNQAMHTCINIYHNWFTNTAMLMRNFS